jgi:hypothetical protein
MFWPVWSMHRSLPGDLLHRCRGQLLGLHLHRRLEEVLESIESLENFCYNTHYTDMVSVSPGAAYRLATLLDCLAQLSKSVACLDGICATLRTGLMVHMFYSDTQRAGLRKSAYSGWGADRPGVAYQQEDLRFANLPGVLAIFHAKVSWGHRHTSGKQYEYMGTLHGKAW